MVDTAVTSRALRMLQTTMARKQSQNAEPLGCPGCSCGRGNDEAEASEGRGCIALALTRGGASSDTAGLNMGEDGGAERSERGREDCYIGSTLQKGHGVKVSSRCRSGGRHLAAEVNLAGILNIVRSDCDMRNSKRADEVVFWRQTVGVSKCRLQGLPQ